MAHCDSSKSHAPLIEAAPAKINLTLTVRGRRPDGYHQLESLVAFAGESAADSVELVPGGEIGLELAGPSAAALAGEAAHSNLIMKAAAAVSRVAQRPVTGTFRLVKHLPVAAGIGGGSADAAAALRLLRRAIPDLADSIDWAQLAATIGADVPVCLESRASLMWGRGESVATLPALPPVWAVIANPRVPLSTADVFRALSAKALEPGEVAVARPSVPRFSGLTDLIDFVACRPNDLEAPARRLCPVIEEMQSLLAGLDGALVARMSGSGPTCFALFATAEAADSGARRITARHPGWWVTAATLH